MPGPNFARIIVPGLTESAVAVVNYLGDDKYNPANTTVEIILLLLFLLILRIKRI